MRDNDLEVVIQTVGYDRPQVCVYIPMGNKFARTFKMPTDQARALAEKILKVLGEKGLDADQR